ncbi:MAG TPA: glyoxalase [Leucothrix mucor]|uniref:Glyoxalase n=1 Tax=Leucothrix mucor TaxID=45248 RepID=A0A7V2SXP6_LEUMU|nr:glyoxalase [Leucothrix mucor]
MSFLGVHHISMIVADTERALVFYRDILGLQVATDRPDLDFKGAWLIITNQQQIHLLEVPNPDSPQRPQHGGRDRHVALQVSDLENLRLRLDANKIAYTISKSGRKALFCRDFDANTLEFIE